MNITVKNLMEETKSYFDYSIEFANKGNTKDACIQYGFGKAYLGLLRDITGWNVSNFAPELLELDEKAFDKIYQEV